MIAEEREQLDGGAEQHEAARVQEVRPGGPAGTNRFHDAIFGCPPDGYGSWSVMAKRDDRLQGEIEELFADLWRVPRLAGLRHGFRPNVDCFHTDDPHALTIVVELPGVDPASIRIAAGERLLLLAGERRRPRVLGRVYQQMEIEYGAFQRQVRLAEDVDPERASAAFENGVLTIVLPVALTAPPSGHITIEVRRA